MTDIAERIAKYKELLDSGALTQEEFDALKAKALTEELGEPVVAEPEIIEVVELDVTEVAETEGQSDETGRPKHPGGVPQTQPPDAGAAEVDRDNPVTVTFTIEGNRLFPEVESADGSKFKDGFIKPQGQSVSSFCAEVAKMMERDMGRLVRWKFVGTRKKAARPVLTIDSKHAWIFVAACVAVVAAMFVWLTFANRVTYKGDVRGLVSHCQTMGKYDKETVEVTGYIWQGEKEETGDVIVLTSDGNVYGYRVVVNLKKRESTYNGSRTTVRGTVSGLLVDSNYVHVTDAEIVK